MAIVSALDYPPLQEDVIDRATGKMTRPWTLFNQTIVQNITQILNTPAAVVAATVASAGGGGLRETFRGLHLRTSPDADVAARRVTLVHADAITLDDGITVEDWDNLSADITLAGAGGLDIGAEAASVWYEIYAIRQSSDGAKNLLLHRAKDHFLDEEYTTGEDNTYEVRRAASVLQVGQGFSVDTEGPLAFIDVKLSKIGAPTGRLWFTVESDASGVPSNVILATSDKLDMSLLTTTTRWIRVIFRAAAVVTAGTVYHLVAQGDNVVDGANNARIAIDATAAAYAKGTGSQDISGTWTAQAGTDWLFKVYVTRNEIAVRMPGDYNQYAKVGYVYNTGPGDFRAFVALDREVSVPATALGGVVATAPELLDLNAHAPPCPVLLRLLANHTGGISIGYASGVPDGHGGLGTPSVATFVSVSVGNNMPFDRSGVPTEAQAYYVWTSSQTANQFVNGWRW